MPETQTRPTGRDAIKAWLLDYAWNGTPTEQAAEVDCIMAQEGWEYVEDRADRYAGMSESGGGPEAFNDALGFALSELYECHDGPHQPTCPNAPQESPC